MEFASKPHPNEMRIGINGFGRVGRMVARSIIYSSLASHSSASVPQRIVCINDPGMSIENLAYLMKHDSVYGSLKYAEKELNISVDTK